MNEDNAIAALKVFYSRALTSMRTAGGCECQRPLAEDYLDEYFRCVDLLLQRAGHVEGGRESGER